MNSTSDITQLIELPPAGRYVLDPGRSAVTFRTRHLFGLLAVSGTMRVAAGEFVVDPAVPGASVTVTVSASSFTTGSRPRDRDVRSARFLHVEEYPELTFRAGILSQDHGRWTLTGELEVRGVSKPVTVAIDSVRDGRPRVLRARHRAHRPVRLRRDRGQGNGGPVPRH